MKTGLNGTPGVWFSCRVTSVALSVELDPQAVLPSLPLVKLPGNKLFQSIDHKNTIRTIQKKIFMTQIITMV